MECTSKPKNCVLYAHSIRCFGEIEKPEPGKSFSFTSLIVVLVHRWVLIENIKKMNEMKQNKTHKNGNLKINFHLNGYLHINATYKLRTIITVSVSLIFLLFVQTHSANVNKSEGILSELISNENKMQNNELYK